MVRAIVLVPNIVHNALILLEEIILWGPWPPLLTLSVSKKDHSPTPKTAGSDTGFCYCFSQKICGETMLG